MDWWETIKNYYSTIGKNYKVDPLVFLGIHIIATPLFAGAVWWIIYNKKKKKSIVIPGLVAVFVFNAANIYLIVFGKGIPYYIYAIVGLSAFVSGYFTFKKINKKITSL